MEYLIEAAKVYDLEQLAGEFMKHDSVHGILIDLDPLWLRAYARHLKFPNTEIDLSYLDYLIWGDAFTRHPLTEYWNDRDSPYFETAVPFDIHWFPKDWHLIFQHNNLRMRVQLRPGSQPVEIAEKQTAMQIIQEHSAVPEFCSSKAKKIHRPLQGGVSIGQGTGDPGTLGGILIDKENGRKYGLTCGHVIPLKASVDQPSSIDSSKSAGVIGSCVYTDLPKPSPGQLCNPSHSALNTMDIALIEIDPAIAAKHSVLNIGSIKNAMPAAKLHPNLKIEYNGRSSGHQTLVIGGILYSQEVDDPISGQKCCFSNLIELRQPSFLHLCFKRPVESGDSGAWILGSGATGLEWCGMIVAENRQSGYAIRSEDILKHLSAQGYNLEI